MSGHIFHPGHTALHGLTVVVETSVERTYVGRYDSEDERGLHLLDVGVHDQRADVSKEEYLRRSSRFGIRSDQKHVVVPANQVTRITRLSELGA